MLEYIYQWIENIVFYLVLLIPLMQMIPGEPYKKYIRFFAGMILIMMLAKPLLNLTQLSGFQEEEYKRLKDEISQAIQVEEEMIIGE